VPPEEDNVAEYAVPTVPLGSEVVVMVTVVEAIVGAV
jgi:hypothetical protein